MEVAVFLVPWLILGIALIYVAFSGGPARARQNYLTRGRGVFRWAIIALYVGAGLVVPAVVIAGGDESVGRKGAVSSEVLEGELARGKDLFRENCASCHNLDAINARGVTGPDLDELGEVKPDRVVNSIRIGGTGKLQMPAGLLEDEDAEAVAAYVSKVAGQ